MNARIKACVAVFVFLAAYAVSDRAEGVSEEYSYEELVKEIKVLKERVIALEKKVATYENSGVSLANVREEIKKSLVSYEPGKGVSVEPVGLRIGASGTFVFQGTPNANNAGDGEDSVFNASYKANVEIEKKFGDWGLAYAEFEAGENDSIESGLTLFSNVNRAASDTDSAIEVSKLWYEHYLFGGAITLTGGKIEAADYMDQNEYAYDENAQFLGHMFRNSPLIEFPDGSGPGLQCTLCLEPIEFVELSGGVFEADCDWNNIFDHMFYVVQLNLIPQKMFASYDEKWGGNYRFYFWANDRCHEKIVEEGELASCDTKETNYGFGISCDQKVADLFGLFGRFGWQRPDILPAGVAAEDVQDNPALQWMWQAGMQIGGEKWRRPSDTVGFAIGQVFPGSKWDKAFGDCNKRSEIHIETYYRCELNECLAISPDFQVIWNPYGAGKSSETDNDTIFVYGVRGEINF
ncbi:MAG: carbohydrate porin [Candidatus Omnitrophica bacterium]|nr:carbohydrate porin [Candidatus Omnitrophota bacterium]